MRLGTDPIREFRRFDRLAALAFARGALAAPPARPTIKRPELRGECVARFVLPLELCLPQNRTRQRVSYEQGKTKKALWSYMLAQAGFRIQKTPLPGHPQVICVRFSPVECDPYADFAKAAVDFLCVPKGRQKVGLGYLRGDRGSQTEQHQRWEPAPHKTACVYIEVRS